MFTRSVVALVLAMSLSSYAYAQIIHVPGDHPTIQQAINAAEHGDEIIVAPGTYFENINLLGKAITLRSSDGPEVTIIDGQNIATAIRLDSGEGPDTIIDGFTVRNNWQSSNKWAGAGISNIGSSPTVRNCRFIGNTWARAGWGMYNEGGSPTIIDCTFAMAWNYDSFGGGILNVDANVTISGSTFSENVNSHGGAAILSYGGHVILSGSTVEKSFSHLGTSAAVTQNGGKLEVIDSTFTENRDLWWETASAISKAFGAADPIITVHNSTFHNNMIAGAVVTNAQEIVGSTFIGNSSLATVIMGDGIIQDCIFIDNSGSTTSAVVSVTGNTTITGSTFMMNHLAWSDAGVINAHSGGVPSIGDSVFCGNQPNNFIGQWTDLSGNTFGEFCPIGDLNGDGVVDVSDLLILLGAWGPCPKGGTPVPPCPADLNGDGVMDVSDLLILLTNWG